MERSKGMQNTVYVNCPTCGQSTRVLIDETGDEAATITCSHCGKAAATVGQAHALVAQQALGLGVTELRDDHVPVNGAFGEQPRK